jgi:hypothetical protein
VGAGEVVYFFDGVGDGEEVEGGEDFAGVDGAGVEVEDDLGRHCCCLCFWLFEMGGLVGFDGFWGSLALGERGRKVGLMVPCAVL